MNLRYFCLGACFGAFIMAGAMTVFVFPYVLFGDCSLRWSDACTPEEMSQAIDRLKQAVIKN
jgi:hypothetical protein